MTKKQNNILTNDRIKCNIATYPHNSSVSSVVGFILPDIQEKIAKEK